MRTRLALLLTGLATLIPLEGRPQHVNTFRGLTMFVEFDWYSMPAFGPDPVGGATHVFFEDEPILVRLAVENLSAQTLEVHVPSTRPPFVLGFQDEKMSPSRVTSQKVLPSWTILEGPRLAGVRSTLMPAGDEAGAIEMGRGTRLTWLAEIRHQEPIRPGYYNLRVLRNVTSPMVKIYEHSFDVGHELRAVRTDVDRADFLVRRSTRALESRDRAAAIEDLKAVIQLVPDAWPVYRFLGDLERLEERQDSARAAYQTALAILEQGPPPERPGRYQPPDRARRLADAARELRNKLKGLDAVPENER